MADKKIVLKNVEVNWAKLQEAAPKYMSEELDMIKKCIVVCIDVKNPDMKQDFLEDEVNNIDKLIKKLGEVESD